MPLAVTDLKPGFSTGPREVTIHPSGKYAYVTNMNNTISQFAIGPTGTFSPLFPDIVTVTGSGGTSPTPMSLAVDPSGAHAYVARYGDNTISRYTIDQVDGTLKNPVDTFGGFHPTFITINPSGKYAYWLTEGINCGGVVQRAIGVECLLANTGSDVAAGVYARFVTTDASVRYVYVANNGSGANGSISQYYVDSNGVLKANSPAGVTVTGGASSIAITSGDSPL